MSNREQDERSEKPAILTDERMQTIIDRWARTSDNRMELCRAIEAELAAVIPPASDVPGTGEPYGYGVESLDGHISFFKDDPHGFRQAQWRDLGMQVHVLYTHPSPVAAPVAVDRNAVLEEAASIAENHSLAEKLVRMTMGNPVSHVLNLVGVIAKEIRTLKSVQQSADKPATITTDTGRLDFLMDGGLQVNGGTAVGYWVEKYSEDVHDFVSITPNMPTRRAAIDVAIAAKVADKSAEAS